MRRCLGWIFVAVLLFAATAWSHESHSLEGDEREVAAELRARARAALRTHWRAADWKREETIEVKLLGVNDFHGQLSPRALGTRPAGGAAVLVSYLKDAAARAPGASFVIHAGDHVGASPPNSALLQDEPAISVLNALANPQCRLFSLERRLPRSLEPYAQLRCNVIGTLGNHEFDEGSAELLRLLTGGNHPKGPFLDAKWRGARFPYVSANVIDAASGETLLAPYTVKLLTGGVRLAVIGAVLKETPTVVTPTGVAGLRFLDEADAINASVRELRKQGIRAIVVTIHQGTRQASFEGPTDPARPAMAGAIVDIVGRLDDEVDVVISGHTHAFTNALVPTASGKPVLVAQAFSASTAYDDIDLSIDRKSGDVMEKSASIVTTFGDQGPGLTPDPDVAALVAAADQRVAPLVNEVVGTAQVALTRVKSPAGESSLGNLIADAQRSVGAQLAFMNPGGIRADLDAGEVTWGELFTIQPFGNDIVLMDLTGAQIKLLLEQQWLNQPSPRMLEISGLRYTWSASRALGDRVVEIRGASGQLLDPAATFRVAVNSFIAAGGDNFLVLVEGTNRVVGPVDLAALVEYVRGLAQPFSAQIEGRIARID